MRRVDTAGIVCIAGILVFSGLAPLVATPGGATDSGIPPPTWSDLIPIDGAAGGNSTSPALAMDPQGNAFAVWLKEAVRGCRVENRSCSVQVWANRFLPLGGWSRPTQIGGWGASSDPANASWISVPQVAVGLGGNAVVVWRANDTVWATYFLPAYGWGTPTPIPGRMRNNWTVGDGLWWQPPPVAIDRLGGATVLWDDVGWGRSNVWANYFAPGSGWHESVLLARNASTPRIAVDDRGASVAAVWLQGTLGSSGWCNRVMSLGASWFVPGQGWGGPVTLDASTCVDTEPRVAVAPNGAAVVAWTGSDSWPAADGNVTLWAATVTAAGWSSASALGTPVARLSETSMAVDGKGNATVAYCTHTNYGDCGDVWTARFAPGSGWEAARIVYDPVDPAFLYFLGVDVEGGGRATYVWSEFDGPSSAMRTWARRLEWSSAVPVSPAAGDAWFPRLALDSSGDTAVVWTQSDGNRTAIYARLLGFLVSGDVTPPILTLSSPSDGLWVTVPSVTVAGWTEPGVTLVVSSILVAVPFNGAFSVVVPLSLGMNNITAVATDAAGNQAAAFVRVTYAMPADLWIPLAVVLEGLLLAGFVVWTILLLVKSRKLQRRGTSDDRSRTDHGHAASRGSSGAQDGVGSSGTPPGGVAPKRPESLLWPDVPEDSPIYLSAKERVALHLLQYAKYTDATEVTPELTQEGIATAAGFERRHFTQYVRPLVRDGLVQERNVHVEGALQKRRVYVLTYEGWRRAMGVRDRIRSVPVDDGSGSQELAIGDLVAETHGSKSLLDVVRESIEKGAGGPRMGS